MVSKILKGIFLILIAGLIGWFVLVWLWPRYESWRMGRQYEKWEESVIRLYQEDVYGGATPQETFDLFLTALRAGDLDLASKYFVLERQGEWRENLEELKQDKMLDGSIDQWSRGKTTWKKSKDEGQKIYYSYETKLEKESIVYDELLEKEVTIPPGSYKHSIIFSKNTYSNIWKIETL